MKQHITISLVLFFVTSFVWGVQIEQKTIKNFIQQYPQATYIQCTKNYAFHHQSFPLYQTEAEKYFSAQGVYGDLFILQAPQASAYIDKSGYVFINNCFLQEMQTKDLTYFIYSNVIQKTMPAIKYKIRGRVAIVTHLYPQCYGHWIFDILGQLALLELHNIEYDYLFVPYFKSFMKESLAIWGIDSSKIIPLLPGLYFDADEIVMTSSVSRDQRYMPKANYYVDFLLHYVRDKMWKGAAVDEQEVIAEKIFVSRKDAGGKRLIPNEDEVFALFEPLGFKRYELAKLSMKQQLTLFYGAKIIVSFSGSGGTNVLFCKPEAHYIEMAQKMIDATFFYVADSCGITYSMIDDSTYNDLLHGGPWSQASSFSIEKVQRFLEKHSEL